MAERNAAKPGTASLRPLCYGSAESFLLDAVSCPLPEKTRTGALQNPYPGGGGCAWDNCRYGRAVVAYTGRVSVGEKLFLSVSADFYRENIYRRFSGNPAVRIWKMEKETDKEAADPGGAAYIQAIFEEKVWVKK